MLRTVGIAVSGCGVAVILMLVLLGGKLSATALVWLLVVDVLVCVVGAACLAIDATHQFRADVRRELESAGFE